MKKRTMLPIILATMVLTLIAVVVGLQDWQRRPWIEKLWEHAASLLGRQL